MSNTPLIVLFSGPPRCGKDTAVDYLVTRIPDSFIIRMSSPIKAAFRATTNLSFSEVTARHEASKEASIPLFSSKIPTSYRQWQIDFSEKFMKPRYGDDIFSKLFILRTQGFPTMKVVLVPDCGFQIEYDALVAHFGLANVLLVSISRPGCTFAGDSRSYITKNTLSPVVDCEVDVALHNHGSLDEYYFNLASLGAHINLGDIR